MKYKDKNNIFMKGIIKKALMALISMLKWEKKIPVVSVKSPHNLLDGKVALITGGSGGIGMAIAKSLLESGCRVIIAGTNVQKLKKCVDTLSSDAKYLVINMNDSASFALKIKEAASIFGNIQLFVSSAGVHSEGLDFLNMTEKEYDRVMNINLKGTYFFSQSVAKYLIDNKLKGKLLLVSSSRGSEPAWSPYGMSKWGLNGMVKGLAKELFPYGINVNAIAPGSTATSLLGYKKGESIYTDDNSESRMIMPEEIGNLTSLLLSDAGNMINGEIIHISSGRGVYDIR